RKAFGDQHPVTCVRANKVAVLYADMGRFPEAEALMRQNLEVQLRGLGEDNPEVATTLANLAAVHLRRNLIPEAEGFYRRAVVILERSRSNDRKLVTILSHYAWLLRQNGRNGEARKLEARAAAIVRNRGNDWARYTVDVRDLLPPH